MLNVDVVKGVRRHRLAPCVDLGLDGSLGFPPHNALWEWLPHQHVGAVPGFAGNILSYRALVEDAIRKLASGIPETSYPGVMVDFDNTARRQCVAGHLVRREPLHVPALARGRRRSVAHRDPEHRVVFINAWNEWAEGAVLEPSDRFGPTFLQPSAMSPTAKPDGDASSLDRGHHRPCFATRSHSAS